MILDQTYNLLKTKYKEQIENLFISNVRLGLHLTAVELSDASFGVAGSLPDSHFHPDRSTRDYGDFTPTKIKGQKVIDLFETSRTSNTIDTLRIAVLNAISSKIINLANYSILEDTDPIDLIELTRHSTITVVGGFHGYIQKIIAYKNKLYVLELDKNMLASEHKQYYVPAEKYNEIIPVSDVVIITGLTLVNNTIDGLLSSIRPGTQVIVTGPSSSILPDYLFENNVNIIGATRITRPDLLFTVVSEGGAGYHLFRYCARKICILNE